MPRTLFLMRHAKSSWKQSDLPDHDRPLNRRGKRDARAVAETMRELGLVPDCVVTSTARRARSTAKRVLHAFNHDLILMEDARLYEGLPGAYLRIMQELPVEAHTALIIGHNPAISDFCTLIADCQVHLRTADAVQIELPIADWADYRIDRDEGHIVRVISRRDVTKAAKGEPA
ncbi:MAG: histidine phosphatase family protein [Anaerolineae bacterium]|nr:histidine phosphatase family protein [Anaerolineae bacterium]